MPPSATASTARAVAPRAQPALASASVAVFVRAGSRDEPEARAGVSHFLEHMAFKGTTRRSSREIVEEIEAVGGDLNAGTSTETTAYYARVLKADVPLALDVLSDILSEPAFDPAELRREQNVIVQEIGAARDNPDDHVFDLFQTAAFPSQPIGRTILADTRPPAVQHCRVPLSLPARNRARPLSC